MQSIASVSSRRPTLVVVAADVVGRRMAGPGLRVVEIARQLSEVADVTLAIGVEGSDVSFLRDESFTVRAYSGSDELGEIVSAHDIAFCQLIDENVIRRAVSAGCRVIFDLYNALPAEAIGAERIGGFTTQPEKDDVFTGVLGFFRFAMRAGSFFVTSNERQRDFWVGYMLAAEGLLPSQLRGRDLSEIVGLAPFGMEDSPPRASRRAIRDGLGVPDDAQVLLWAGGIWDWFDAETPIRAVAQLAAADETTHLVFYGTTHPNSLIGTPPAVSRAKELARELGVIDRTVHFVDGWVPADQRADYLLDADVALSAHKPSFETRYAFRTRILDHFWAHLPSIVTEGDWFADYIDAENLGAVVPYGDPDAMVEAILSLRNPAQRDRVRANVTTVRERWRWSSTMAELRDAVANWESRLPERTLAPEPAPSPAPPPPTRLARLRRIVAASPLAPLLRKVRSLVVRR